MVDHKAMRVQLMDGAIKTVAERGLEGLTTRSIEQYSDVNDAYIYRYFIDKDDLLTRTYLREMSHITTIIFESISKETVNIQSRDKCYEAWNKCNEYLAANPNIVKFCLRFRYSTYYLNVLDEIRNERIERASKEKTIFLPDTNIALIFEIMVDAILSYNMRIINGELDDTVENSSVFYEMLYDFLSRHVADTTYSEVPGKEKMSYLEFYSIVQSWK